MEVSCPGDDGELTELAGDGGGGDEGGGAAPREGGTSSSEDCGDHGLMWEEQGVNLGFRVL